MTKGRKDFLLTGLRVSWLHKHLKKYGKKKKTTESDITEEKMTTKKVMIMKMRKKVSKSQMKTNRQPARKKTINQYSFPLLHVLFYVLTCARKITVSAS
jgi:hypothetical protein